MCRTEVYHVEYFVCLSIYIPTSCGALLLHIEFDLLRVSLLLCSNQCFQNWRFL